MSNPYAQVSKTIVEDNLPEPNPSVPNDTTCEENKKPENILDEIED